MLALFDLYLVFTYFAFTRFRLPMRLVGIRTTSMRGLSTMTHRYYPSQLDSIENIELYRLGGFHPISIGDTFNSRYRVLHKLGFGGSSTVWLARDLQHQAQSSAGNLVTLKVLSAEQSSKPKSGIPELSIPMKLHDILRQRDNDSIQASIQTVNDHFMHSGPNGDHLCFVHPLSGPSVCSMSESTDVRVVGSRRLRADLARRVAHQTASALALMHSVGLVHGGSSNKFLTRLDPCLILNTTLRLNHM